MTENLDRIFRWVMALFALACAALVLQSFPSLWSGGVYILDVRNWSWTAVWIVNGVVILSLIAYRLWQNR